MQGLKDNSRSLDFIQNAEEAPKDYLEEWLHFENKDTAHNTAA
jgi:hypothetical protein